LLQDKHYLRTDQTDLPLEPFKLGVPSGATKNGFLAYGALGTNRAHILHRNKHYLEIDRGEFSYDTHHLGVLSGASKLISKHMVCSMQTVHPIMDQE
jgi:hypothetical protein